MGDSIQFWPKHFIHELRPPGYITTSSYNAPSLSLRQRRMDTSQDNQQPPRQLALYVIKAGLDNATSCLLTTK